MRTGGTTSVTSSLSEPVSNVYTSVTPQVSAFRFSGVLLRQIIRVYRRFFKRLLDLVTAFLLIIVTFPFMLGAMLVLAVANKGRVWFIQPRPGVDGRIFRLIKFKTMTDERDQDGNLLPDEARLTAAGKIIRKTSLDELPQLLNVLKGDMSLVGPRPLLVEYLPLYNAAQRRRHDVRPGITGWAQVNGRNTLSWKDRFAMDVWYVDHLSFSLDLKILFLTLIKVFRAEGISGEGSVTMKKFTGNPEPDITKQEHTP